MAKREFLMKAATYNSVNHQIGGWFMSEKLDFRRAWWDGGISRGIVKSKIPWSNRDKDIHDPVCTGLWSPYGNTIQAPDWWLDKMPMISLDGELSKADRGLVARSEVMSATKKLIPIDYEWEDINLRAFDSPPPEIVLGTGRINNTNFKKLLNWRVNETYIPQDFYEYRALPTTVFRYRYNALQDHYEHTIPHFKLPMGTLQSERDFGIMMHDVVDNGGEGMMAHNPDTYYACERVKHVVKSKPFSDMEGVVVGWISGKSGVGTKFVGLMGSLVLRLENGAPLELSGFTDDERDVGDQANEENKRFNTNTVHFKIGQKVTFKYRELSPDGVPIEARYHRPRGDDE
tara:strand:- start:6309 stop:7343 length:1035 start_codon:yes stop_codon:yes gene_type:complete